MLWSSLCHQQEVRDARYLTEERYADQQEEKLPVLGTEKETGNRIHTYAEGLAF
jgi:hypothetical protein